MPTRKIDVYPENKEHVQRLMKFNKKVVWVLRKFKITPVLYGGLAYFFYVKNPKETVKDIDYLIPEAKFEKIMAELDRRKMRYEYLPDWRSIIVHGDGVSIDLDSIDKKKLSGKYMKVEFGGQKMKVVSKEDLKKMYGFAAGRSHDKPEEHKRKLERLEGRKKSL